MLGTSNSFVPIILIPISWLKASGVHSLSLHGIYDEYIIIEIKHMKPSTFRYRINQSKRKANICFYQSFHTWFTYIFCHISDKNNTWMSFTINLYVYYPQYSVCHSKCSSRCICIVHRYKPVFLYIDKQSRTKNW